MIVDQPINQAAIDHVLMNFDGLKFKSIRIGGSLFQIITNSSCTSLYKLLISSGDDTKPSQSIGLNSPSDLTPGVYEGGFKVWECSRDMIDFILNDLQLTGTTSCLDLGCGSGIVGICLLKSTGASVDFQDFNYNVLLNYTLPNILVNCSDAVTTESWKQLSPRINFIAGDWSSFPKTKTYDYIFSCETIYNQDNYTKLSDMLINCLSPDGCAFFAAKSYYFGVGGGVQEFQDFLAGTQLSVEQVKTYPDCVERIIMKITLKKS